MKPGKFGVLPGKRALILMLGRLEDARRHATLESMLVDEICCDPKKTVPKLKDGRKLTEANVNEFIRERLKLHHASWVIGPVDEVITALKAAIGEQHAFMLPYKGWSGDRCHLCGETRNQPNHKPGAPTEYAE